MNEIDDIPRERIYSYNEIWVSSILCGPLAAGYLVAQNFKAFNEKKKGIYTWIIAIITTVISLITAYYIPDDFKIPKITIPLIYTLITYLLVECFQGNNIKGHIKKGGKFFGWFRSIGISILFLFITVLPIIGAYYYSQSQITTKTYGKMKHEITYKNKNISEEEVDRIADIFVYSNFFDVSETKYVYLDKVNDNYEISFSVVDGIKYNEKVLGQYTQYRNELQTFFPKNKIVFKLVVDDLDNVIKCIE